MNRFGRLSPKNLAQTPACALIIALSASVAGAATATGTSGKPGAKPSDSGENNWVFSTPTTADTVSFSSGTNSADAVAFPGLSYGPFTKFAFPGPTGTFAIAFSRTDLGPRKSKAITSGVYSSGVGSDPLGVFTAYNFTWTVNASGKLGPTPPVDWRAISRGIDPWSIFPSDLSNISGNLFDLFFTAGLKEGDVSPNGEIGFQVGYETAAGTINLLQASLQPTLVTVSGDGPANMQIFRLANEFEGPTEVPANMMTYGQIQSALASDVMGDLTLNQPMILGFVLHGIEVPTVPMSDGALARVHASVYAVDWDAAEGPEPTGIALAGLGITCLAARRGTRGQANF